MHNISLNQLYTIEYLNSLIKLQELLLIDADTWELENTGLCPYIKNNVKELGAINVKHLTEYISLYKFENGINKAYLWEVGKVKPRLHWVNRQIKKIKMYLFLEKIGLIDRELV